MKKEPSAETQSAARKAGERLHHLSMIYGAAILELAQGKEVGMVPTGYPGLKKMRDLADLILLTRAEINGLTNLLIEAGVLDLDKVSRTFAEEYEWLTQQKAKQFGVGVSEHGLVFKVGGDSIMPGPVSDSYEGPSDDKPQLPSSAFQPLCSTGQQLQPLSYEEAKWLHEGFLAGATVYATACGHSALKSDNEILRKVFDEQGYKTLTALERTPPMPAELEKHIADWLRVNEKRPEQVIHGTFPLGMVQRWIERAEDAERRLARHEAQS